MPGFILIVEDSEPCVMTLEFALSGLTGLETRTAHTAAEALRIIETSLTSSESGTIRALVTDLNLPAMDGFELIQRVRSQARHARLPILVTSGDSDPGNSATLNRLGVDAYFVKPYSPAAVRRTLEGLLHAT
jgi:CheY-like chemotaxis protein